MKLRLPLLLLSCILSIPVTLPATADVIGNGVIYDVGKTAFSNADIPNKQVDEKFCWAAGAVNALQYWQDTYGEYVADDWSNTPNGVKADGAYSDPTGTKYLEMYQYACGKAWVLASGKYDTGYPNKFIEWYAKGTDTEELQTQNGYYQQLFTGHSASKTYDMDVFYPDDEWGIGYFFWDEGQEAPDMHAEKDGDNSLTQQWKNISDFIVDSFKIQGQAATLCINEGHIVNCWGYETNAEGLVTSLILTNMDDSTFGAFRVKVGIDMATTEIFDLREDGGGISYSSCGERLILQTDDGNCLNLETFGGQTLKPWLSSAYSVATPEADEVTINEQNVNLKALRELKAPNASITEGQTLKENTRIVNDVEIKGAGITVGDGKSAVVLTSDANEALKLNGKDETSGSKSETDGMHVADGGMVSLRNIEITGYAGDGIENDAKTYLHDGQVTISDNDGHGITNTKETSYVEIMDNTSVTVSNNAAGGINNEKGTVSIRGNGNVTFSGNTVEGGNDIYNSANGIVNIADNGSVTFIGDSGKAAKENVSVVNEGELYLAAKEGDRITFRNSALETTGTTYIGRDISDSSPDTAGEVLFTDASGTRTSIRANQTTVQPYATLENLSVTATEIMGAGEDNGIVSNAIIASLGGMTMKNLSLDTSDSINSMGKSFIEYDNVVLTLNMDDMKDKTFNLTGVFSGNMTMKALTFDLSETNISGESLSDFTFDLSTAFAEREKMNLMFKTFDGTYTLQAADSQVLLAAAPLPEPTTGTLSLLALAGLAARRRRK